MCLCSQLVHARGNGQGPLCSGEGDGAAGDKRFKDWLHSVHQRGGCPTHLVLLEERIVQRLQAEEEEQRHGSVVCVHLADLRFARSVGVRQACVIAASVAQMRRPDHLPSLVQRIRGLRIVQS